MSSRKMSVVKKVVMNNMILVIGGVLPTAQAGKWLTPGSDPSKAPHAPGVIEGLKKSESYLQVDEKDEQDAEDRKIQEERKQEFGEQRQIEEQKDQDDDQVVPAQQNQHGLAIHNRQVFQTVLGYLESPELLKCQGVSRDFYDNRIPEALQSMATSAEYVNIEELKNRFGGSPDDAHKFLRTSLSAYGDLANKVKEALTRELGPGFFEQAFPFLVKFFAPFKCQLVHAGHVLATKRCGGGQCGTLFVPEGPSEQQNHIRNLRKEKLPRHTAVYQRRVHQMVLVLNETTSLQLSVWGSDGRFFRELILFQNGVAKPFKPETGEFEPRIFTQKQITKSDN